ncbi:response regulator [Novosphingobium sp. JCM 18896]|uniref:response regulator n=1 Tax=Novosphingobium sp. JCM 18896 TaxID=2989731 RepID=UPI002222CB3F|nr:response regulator [Novosphingobium sp. JCM 18896]MCW1432423.1 response regulator [Novosphingobium sp. JCM 18896]
MKLGKEERMAGATPASDLGRPNALSAKRSCHVLVVEDEAAIRRNLSARLRESGLAVTEAINADEVLEHLDLSANDFDMMITDVHYPGKTDGIELARLASKMNSALPIVVMSGGLTREEVPANFHFIPKPFSTRSARDFVVGILG